MSGRFVQLTAVATATFCLLFVTAVHFLPRRDQPNSRQDALAVLSTADVKSVELHPLHRLHGATGLFTIGVAVHLTNDATVEKLIASMKDGCYRSASLPPMKHWSPDRDVKLVFLLRDGRCIAFRVSLLPAYGVASYEEFLNPDSRLALDPVRSTNRGSDVIYDLIDQAVRGSGGWVSATNMVER